MMSQWNRTPQRRVWNSLDEDKQSKGKSLRKTHSVFRDIVIMLLLEQQV